MRLSELKKLIDETYAELGDLTVTKVISNYIDENMELDSEVSLEDFFVGFIDTEDGEYVGNNPINPITDIPVFVIY